MTGLTTRTAANLGILISIIFLCLGFFSSAPSKEIDYYNYDGNGYKEYVGGDAYNIQIEASLRGGIIAGKVTARAVYFSAAGLTFVISLMGLAKSNNESEQNTKTNTPENKNSDDNISQKEDAEYEHNEEKESETVLLEEK